MNKIWYVGGIVLLLVIILWHSRSEVSEPAAVTVLAPDGQFALTIPDGALPEGLAIEDISITAIPSDAGMSTYELAPVGTQFVAPIDYTFFVPAQPAVAPVVLHESPESLVFLDAAVAYDAEQERIEISGSIQHFSRLTVMHQLLDISPLGGGETTVGESFTAGFRVDPRPEGRFILHTRYFDDYEMRIKPNSSYNLEGVTISPHGPITPLATTKVSDLGTFPFTETYVYPEQQFTCNYPGASYIWFGPLSFAYTITGSFRGDDFSPYEERDQAVVSHAGVYLHYECVGEGEMVQIEPPAFNAPVSQPPIGGHKQPTEADELELISLPE